MKAYLFEPFVTMKSRHKIQTARFILGLMFAMSVVTQSGDAHAYQRWLTCRQGYTITETTPTASPICGPRQSGWPFYWPATTMPVFISQGGTKSFPTDNDGKMPPALYDAIVEAVEVWNEPTCSKFAFTIKGMTDKSEPRVDDKTNLITWNNDQWIHQQSAIAITSSTVTAKGKVVDTDLELNGQYYQWSLKPDDPDNLVLYDVKNVITHEAGHMLGLDHPPGAETTMYYEADPGETKKRSLEQDDIDGLCAIYPLPAPPTEDPDTGCCTHTPHGPSTPTSAWLILLLCVGIYRRAPKSTP